MELEPDLCKGLVDVLRYTGPCANGTSPSRDEPSVSAESAAIASSFFRTQA